MLFHERRLLVAYLLAMKKTAIRCSERVYGGEQHAPIIKSLPSRRDALRRCDESMPVAAAAYERLLSPYRIFSSIFSSDIFHSSFIIFAHYYFIFLHYFAACHYHFSLYGRVSAPKDPKFSVSTKYGAAKDPERWEGTGEK